MNGKPFDRLRAGGKRRTVAEPAHDRFTVHCLPHALCSALSALRQECSPETSLLGQTSLLDRAFPIWKDGRGRNEELGTARRRGDEEKRRDGQAAGRRQPAAGSLVM